MICRERGESHEPLPALLAEFGIRRVVNSAARADALQPLPAILAEFGVRVVLEIAVGTVVRWGGLRHD